jgi:uncharacterized protein
LVHIFGALGRSFALDVESGNLFELDAEAAKVLSGLTANGWNTEAVADSDIVREFVALRCDGQLDSAEADVAPPSDPGVIKAMCLNVAHDCNLRCRYCFAGQGEYNNSSCNTRMPLDVGIAALEFLMKRSGNRRNLEVDFFGGEPLLNFDNVRRMVEAGRELERKYNKKISFTMTTNAAGVTDEIADWINAEMDNCVLSIDGRREVHDRMRPDAGGHGSYDKCAAGALRVVSGRGGKAYYARGTYTAHNLDFHLDALALADAGFANVSVEPVVAQSDKPYALNEAMLPEIFASYDKLAEEIVKRSKGASTGKPFTFFHFITSGEHEPCLRKRLMGCGAGNEYAAVTPDGDIYPCHQFVGRESFRMGNVIADELDSATQKEFASVNILTKSECRKCWAKYHCGGGCAANAHSANGDIRLPDKLSCAFMKKRLELALAMSADE